MADDIDLIDDILLPKKPTTVQALGKFRPKAHSKTNKGVSVPSQTSKVVHTGASNLDSSCNANAPVEGSSLSSSCIIDSFDATLNQNNNEKNVAVTNGMASEVLASIDSNLGFNVEDMGKEGDVVVRLASDDNLWQPTSVAVAEKSDSAENHKDCGTELDISPSQWHNSQDPLLPEGSKTLDERHVLQPDSNVLLFPEKQKEEGMLVASAFEPIDDIFHTDAARKAGKFRPKFASHPNKAKAKKSVSFDLPCSSDNTTATDPLIMGIPDLQLKTDAYKDNNSQYSLTTSDLSDNGAMDHQNPTDEDMSEQLIFEGFSNSLSQPSSSSVQDAGKFQPNCSSRRWDMGDLESSGSIYALEVESLEHDSLVKDTTYVDHHASGILDFQYEFGDHNEELEHIPETADFHYEFDERNIEQNFEESGQDAGEEMQYSIINEELPLSEIIKDIGKHRKRVNRHGKHTIEERDQGDLNFEDSNVSRMDEDESDGECRVDVAKNKRIRRNTKGLKSGSDETAKRKGKASKKSEITEVVPQKKKFPHSTKRKRRQVDKVLLETPEYEINFKQIAIKDLILLGEAKERISNKEASTKRKSISDKSIEETSHDDCEENPAVEATKYFNYGSYSNRVKAPRWSKTETELWYKAIRQFGTDFAMIQQLFPHRTRHQVKLKFKNEERKHPMLVHDALCDRSNDLSHLKQVIEKLQINKEQATDEIDYPSTDVLEDAVGDDEEERTEIQQHDVVHENDLGGEVKSPEHSGDAEYEAESPTDFDDYQSAWD